MLNQTSKAQKPGFHSQKRCSSSSSMQTHRHRRLALHWDAMPAGHQLGLCFHELFFFDSLFPLPRKHDVQQAHTSLYKRRDEFTLCRIVPRQTMLTESGCVSPCKVVIMVEKKRWDYKTEQLVYKAWTQKPTSPGLIVSPRRQWALSYLARSHSTGDTNRLKAWGLICNTIPHTGLCATHRMTISIFMLTKNKSVINGKRGRLWNVNSE